MISDAGKGHILKAMTGVVASIANYVLLGVDQTAEASDDTGLGLEITRVPITSVSPDLDNQRIVFSASVQPGLINTIYEIGLLYTESLDAGRTLPIPGSEMSFWTNSSLVTTNARASLSTLKVDFVASGTTLAEDSALNADLSALRGVDSIKFAFYSTANVSSLRFRIGSDSSNYFEFVVSAPTAGYHVVSFPISSASVTGSPTWGNVLYFAVSVTGTSGGSGSVYLDAVRTEPVSETDVLVARTVLGTPYVVNVNVPNSIEYALDVSVA